MAGIYIHIPFCKQACSYCDFHFSTSLNRKTDVLNAIHQEIKLRKDYLPEKEASSIYLGGGTPSLLETHEILKLFDALSKHFDLSHLKEITLEANPDDLSKKKLAELANTPINRLSIGVQSFFDEDLKFMNRAHNALMAKSAIMDAQNAGFQELTIDLIFGNPTTTKQMWEQNLALFFQLNIPHLSAYALTVENNTSLAHQIKLGKVKEPNDEAVFEQYLMLQKAIDVNNFVQYELSNYCKNDQIAIHNTSYWKNEPYLGLGPSAHSYNGKSRQWNVSNNISYLKAIAANEDYYEVEQLSVVERYHDLLITALRTKWGLNLNQLKKDFPLSIFKHFNQQLETINQEQYIIETDHFKLNRSVWFQSDHIIKKLMI